MLALALGAGQPVPALGAGDKLSALGAGQVTVAVPGPTGASCTAAGPMLDMTFTRSILTSIVTDGDEAWAVGMTTLAEDPRYALAVRWDGTGWPVMPMRRPKGEQALFAIDRSPAGGLWAAGYRTTSAGYRPMIMHWREGRWQPVRLGAASRRTGVLTGVAAFAEGLVWAVGYRSVRGGQRPFAIRHTASGWSEVDPPLAGGSDGSLMDVASTPGGGTVWAVGWASLRGVPRPYAVQRTRGRWRVVRPPLASASEGVLTSVAVEPSGRAWAVGYQLVGGRYLPLVEHWDGRGWRQVSFPVRGAEITLLRAVSLDTLGQPVLAGTRWDADLGEWRGIVAQRESGRWQLTDAPALEGGSQLRDIALGPDGQTISVGANGRSSLALGVCPRPAAVVPGPSPGPSGPPPPVSSRAPTLPVPSSAPSPGVSLGPSQAPATMPASQAPAEPSPEPATSARVVASPSAGRASARPSSLPRRRGGYRIVARDVARAAGLDRDTSTYGAVRTDIDGDGWPDLFIGRHSNPGWLLVNRGGRFVPAPGVTIRRQDRHGCTAGDADGDGRADLFCSIGALHGAGVKTNELWVQQPDGTFQNQAVAMRAADPVGRGRLSLFFDLDHDRYADLFIANRPDRTDGLPSRHRVLANPTGKRYEPRSVIGIDAASGADCLRAADLDRDGWTDIVMCQRADSRPDGVGIRVLRNVHGRLVDVTARVGLPVRDIPNVVDAIVADMNGDRYPDIVHITPWELRVWIRRDDRYIPGYRRTLVSAVALAAGDVNGDGALDLYVVQGTGERQRGDLMLVNRGGGWRFRWMAIPQVPNGSAEGVVAIDHDRNGLADFLVLNGRTSTRTGPVQLIAFYPAGAARSPRTRARP
jgi:hypothetical protein